MPFVRDYKFVGREDILDQIEERLHGGHRISLAGIGGVGKSQIAIEYAYRFHKQHEEIQIFWVYAANQARFEQAYAEIAEKLNIPRRDDPKVNQKKIVLDWLSDKSHGHWLMILDSADDRSLFFPEINADTSHDSSTPSCLSDYLPPSSIEHGSLVITTRNKKLGMDLADGEDPIDVQPFTPAEAELLLESKVATAYWDAEAGRDLLKVLCYIPLAITQAAAFMKQNTMSLKKYRKALSHSDSNLAGYLSTDLLDPRRPRVTPSSVFLTWKLSFDQIRKEEPRAADMLSLMSFLDGQAIPEILLRRGEYLDVKDTNAIGTLQAFSLITVERDDETYSMHRLVQLATQTWLGLQKSRDRWQEEALELLSNELPTGDYKNKKICNALLPHATTVLRYPALSDSSLLRHAAIMHNLAWFDLMQGKYESAHKRCKESYTERRRILGLDDPHTLGSLGLLASTYGSQGRWKEAEELGIQVMEARKRVLGAEHPDTLTSMANLAWVYGGQGRWKEAEELGVQVVETKRRVFGVVHSSTLTSMANLASTYRDQGRWKEAEELEAQVIETKKKVLGVEHPSTLTTIGNLALTYQHQGRWKEARELGVEVIEIKKRVLGAEHPDTLTSMANLALTYRNQGQLNDAKELGVQVMEARKRVLGAEHPDTLTTMANLASTYRDQGRWTEAEELEVKVTEMGKRVLGGEHPDTLASISNLALTYWNQGRWKEAEELGVEVIEIKKRVLGAEHPDTLTSMANLALTYRNQGQLNDAKELGVQVMEARKRVLGEEHPDTLTSMANLALTFWNQRQLDNAKELGVQVVETRKRVLGVEHPDTLTSIANLALTYWDQGRLDEAEVLEVQVMETRKRVLGAEHPETLASMNNLAHTLYTQSRTKEAIQLMEHVVKSFKAMIGANHPKTVTASTSLNAW
ncbi:hypothetical protein OIDMADRAFT_207691, partial [Oidiodendron maius Zn]